MNAYLNVAQVAVNMSVLGYGQHRSGIWVQGCAIGCPGCVSLHTHNPAAGRKVAVSGIIDWMRAQGGSIDGLTISGGEPSEQNAGVRALIDAFREAFPQTDILMFSGLPWRRLIVRHPELVNACDVVIAGPYIQRLPPLPLRGSSNQTVHLLTGLAHERYHDLEQWPIHAAQVVFGKGRMTTVGIPNIRSLTERLTNNGFDPNTTSWIPHN